MPKDFQNLDSCTCIVQKLIAWYFEMAQDFASTMLCLRYGNPLYLPDQQVGLNTLALPPRLSCGVTVPAEKQLVRRFKVGNNSAARVVVSWKASGESVDDLIIYNINIWTNSG